MLEAYGSEASVQIMVRFGSAIGVINARARELRVVPGEHHGRSNALDRVPPHVARGPDSVARSAREIVREAYDVRSLHVQP